MLRRDGRLQLIGFAMFLLTCCCLPAMARANVLTTISFTAVIGSTGNNIDSDDLFGQGAGANLKGQTISGLVTIDPTSLSQDCLSESCVGATYDDHSGGAITLSYTIGSVTQTVTSVAPVWGDLAGSVGITNKVNGGWNHFSVDATTTGRTLQADLDALLNDASVLSVFGGQAAANANSDAAVSSLSMIGNDTGVVTGGITLLTGDGRENLKATINMLDVTQSDTTVPEPATFALLGSAVAALRLARGKARAGRPRGQKV